MSEEDEFEYDDAPKWGLARFGSRFQEIGIRNAARADGLEVRYLSVLRYLLLLAATLAILGSAGLFLYGAFRQIGPSEVAPAPVGISAIDLAPATIEEAAESGDEFEADVAFSLDSDVKRKTLGIYRQKFASFERRGENPDDGAIIASVWPEERWDSFSEIENISFLSSGNEELKSTKEVALFALGLVDESTTTDGFQKSLNGYKSAKKVQVCRSVTRERSRTVEGWDDYSMNCPGWYYSPIGCPSTRVVSEPYSTRVCEMQFPSDLDTPRDAMAAALDRFVISAKVQSENNFYDAEAESASIKQSKAAGRQGMASSLYWLAGFIGIMLLYLLVALERHHRFLRQLIPTKTEGDD
ncbi:MAG: hypothetical protein MK010_06185 [Erythrobacter sp.]|nr:hypothetical protein [Erythrobacter sp.]